MRHRDIYTGDEVRTGTAHNTRPDYVSGIPKDVQDIVFIQNWRYQLPLTYHPYFDWWVENKTKGYWAEYPERIYTKKNITPKINKMTLTNEDLNNLLAVINASSFSGTQVDTIAALKVKLLAMRLPEPSETKNGQL